MNSEIKYRVIFSRRRSISLIVSPDKDVIVRAPYRTSLRSIERFVLEKSGWIIKHLEKHSALTRLNRGKKYNNGELHLFFGKEHQLKIIESVHPYVNISDGIIEIGTKDISDTLRIKALLDKSYKLKAKEYLAGRFVEITGKFKNRGFFPSGFIVKTLKSRWGSCSFHGRITLSSELIKLDPKFADYVIIHELCHLKHHNHGKEYYRMLEELVPDYKVIRKELRKYLTK
jgi:predicted metal-dependent hydrolase